MTFAALALVAAIASAPCTLPSLATGPRPWRAGEALAWDVDVMGVATAGTLSAAVETPLDGKVPVRVQVKNTSVFAKVKRIRGVATSWVDTRTLLPHRYRDETDEDGLRRTTDVAFDEGGSRLRMAWSYGSSKGTREFDRGPEAMDLVSAVYYLRAAVLEPDRPFCVDLVANRRFWRLEGKLVPGREQVSTPAGTFQAMRVDAVLTRQPTPDDARVRSRPLHLWFSDDARRVPVAAVTEVDLGPVRALLARGAGNR